jgi:hypothetical protein
VNGLVEQCRERLNFAKRNFAGIDDLNGRAGQFSVDLRRETQDELDSVVKPVRIDAGAQLVRTGGTFLEGGKERTIGSHDVLFGPGYPLRAPEA